VLHGKKAAVPVMRDKNAVPVLPDKPGKLKQKRDLEILSAGYR